MQKTKHIGLFLFALLGALLATLCDSVHVYTQTLSYPEPFLFGQAWWVFPGFMMTFLLMQYTCLFLVNRLPPGIPVRKSVSKGNVREMTETITIFALVYLLSGFGNNEPLILSVIFYGTFVMRWLFSYDRLWLFILAALMAVGGMIAEGLLSAAGLVTYRYVDVFYVPFWLGGLYLHGAFALREGMRFFVYKSKYINI